MAKFKSICIECNRNFDAFINSKGKFCNRDCYYKWQKGKPNRGAFEKGETLGYKNYKWMGNNVGYSALHDWIYRWKGEPKECDFCESNKNVQWANKSGKYKRKFNDWTKLCCKCHHVYDGIYEKALITKRNKQFLQV